MKILDYLKSKNITPLDVSVIGGLAGVAFCEILFNSSGRFFLEHDAGRIALDWIGYGSGAIGGTIYSSTDRSRVQKNLSEYIPVVANIAIPLYLGLTEWKTFWDQSIYPLLN